MKYTKSIIGKIAFIETNANYKESIAKIPKEARIMASWELHRLQTEDSIPLKDFPKIEFVWTENRASRLNSFDDYSGFDAVGRCVDCSSCALRGVCVVKKVKQ